MERVKDVAKGEKGDRRRLAETRNKAWDTSEREEAGKVSDRKMDGLDEQMKEKNLIFVFADQWRADALGYAHSDPVSTPNMDNFCEEACYCDHVFSTFPLCSPHRASLLTGRYPLSSGFFTNCKTGLDMRLRDEEVCISDVLSRAGYQTAYIGKWHLDEPEQNNCAEPVSGARNWDAYTPPGSRRHGFEYWHSYGAWDEHMKPHYWEDTPHMQQVNGWSVRHETDQALKYIERASMLTRPFALFLSWNPPHSPYEQVPQKYLEQYSSDITLRPNASHIGLKHHTGERVSCSENKLKEMTKQYFAAVTGLDEQFGRLVTYLKEKDLYKDTILVLSSDHGDMMGSHNLMGKHVWYEEALHIPFIVHIPGSEKRCCQTCIGSQDMMPTLLSLLNLPIPESVEGIDCAAYLIQDKEDMSKACFICACPGTEGYLREFRACGKDPREFGWRGIRTQRYTYVMDLGYQPEAHAQRYLYDIYTDPLQNAPLDLSAAQNRQLALALEAEVREWMIKQGDGFVQKWEESSEKL